MDPINLLVLLNLIATFGANVSGAKKEFKNKVTNTGKKPETYLQKLPLNISALIIVLSLLGIFNIFNLTDSLKSELQNYRLIGLLLYIAFSWLQIHCFKYLGKSYSQEILIYKDHKLVTTGIYKFIRHPQYLSQILSDLGIALALLNFVIAPLVVLIEIPLLILRAKEEEKLFSDFFREKFSEYKKHSGFIIPFIG